MRRHQSFVVNPDEVFTISKSIRWVALLSAQGEVVFCEMRAGLKSASSQEVDRKFLQLGPLTLLGVAEKYSLQLRGLEAVVACYGLITHVHARLGAQVLVVAIENRQQALSDVLDWVKKKKAILQGW
jgi:hypothetical protein